MSRTDAEIDRMVELLRLAWKAEPDWRLGQLVSNSVGPGLHDVFHLEDRDVARGLLQIARRPVTSRLEHDG